MGPKRTGWTLGRPVSEHDGEDGTTRGAGGGEAGERGPETHPEFGTGTGRGIRHCSRSVRHKYTATEKVSGPGRPGHAPPRGRQ